MSIADPNSAPQTAEARLLRAISLLETCVDTVSATFELEKASLERERDDWRARYSALKAQFTELEQQIAATKTDTANQATARLEQEREDIKAELDAVIHTIEQLMKDDS